MPELLITAIGNDRPGLVDGLTQYLFDAGANLADSQMVNLRGRFAFVVLVEADEATLRSIGINITEAGRDLGLHVSVAPQAPSSQEDSSGLAYRFRADALDQPGIVHRIAHLLHGEGINIEQLRSRLHPGPYEGRPRFSIELQMTLPPSVQESQLREHLTRLCDSLNCDFNLQPM